MEEVDKNHIAPFQNEVPEFCVTKPLARKSPEFLDDWLFFLAKTNSENQVEDNEFKENIVSQSVVSLIFNLVKLFEVVEQREVKFLAVEILDRFLYQHVADLRFEVFENNKDRLTYKWDEVQKRITSQLQLRACTAVQVASKFLDCKNFVQATNIKKWLESCGYYYTLENIKSSEMRMMKTLNYKVGILTPLFYIESLLEIISHKDELIKPADIYQVARVALEVYYFKRIEIYDALYRNFTNQHQQMNTESVSTPCSPVRNWETDKAFRKVKSDYMLTASAILTVSAGYLSKSMQNRVGNTLATVTKYPLWCIEVFVGVLEECLIPAANWTVDITQQFV